MPLSGLAVDAVAKAIKLPVANWPCNYYAIACAMLEAELVEGGRAVYGLYFGPIADDSVLSDRPLQIHGWIEVAMEDGETIVVDPTRWVFEAVEPYIYVQPKNDSEYDAGANTLCEMMLKPCPPYDCSARQVTLDLPGVTEDAIRQVMASHMVEADDNVPDKGTFSFDQVFWIANLPLSYLGKLAEDIYRAIVDVKLGALIPWDNRTAVLGDRC